MNRRFLQVILPPWEVLLSVSEFWRSRFPFRTPGGPFSSQIVRKSHFSVLLSNRLSELQTVSSFKLFYPKEKCSCRFRRFGAAVSRSGPPAGRFRGKLFENPIFRCNSLTGSPNCKPSVPTSYFTSMGSSRVSFGVLRSRFPFRTPGGPFSSQTVLKSHFSVLLFNR